MTLTCVSFESLKVLLTPFGLKITDYAGLEISVNSRIAWPFSRQIANVNAGPISALDQNQLFAAIS